jgi:hypothetical protein
VSGKQNKSRFNIVYSDESRKEKKKTSVFLVEIKKSTYLCSRKYELAG